MFAQIRQFLTFAGHYQDNNDYRRAKLVNAVLLTMGTDGWLVIVMMFLSASPIKAQIIAAMLVFILAIAGLMGLLRRGFLQLSAVLSLIVLFLGGTLDAAVFGGVRDPGMTFLIVVIALAALLLGGRTAMLFAGFGSLAALFVHFAQSNNW